MLSCYVNAMTAHSQIDYPIDGCQKNADNVLSIRITHSMVFGKINVKSAAYNLSVPPIHDKSVLITKDTE